MTRLACYRCNKPAATCICGRVERVENRTRVVIVQHPRERFHAVGTVRLLALGLARVEVDIAFHEVGAERPPQLSARAALLYPGPRARPIESLAPSERPEELVVIDGTWHHARTLVRDLPWLRSLPCVSLQPSSPSRYRIRLSPRRECLSTVEAVVQALCLLEPETDGFERLLAAFDSMIDEQLEFIRARRGPRRIRSVRAFGRGLPLALAERFADLVVVYAETARESDHAPRELVQLAALRVASGELFDAVVRRDDAPGLWHMGLEPSALRAGLDPPELRRAWQGFRRDTDLIAAWNQSTLDALQTAGLEAKGLTLKAVYANTQKRAPGSLDAVLDREGLAPAPLGLSGRAAQRLANGAAIARLLHARARETAPRA